MFRRQFASALKAAQVSYSVNLYTTRRPDKLRSARPESSANSKPVNYRSTNTVPPSCSNQYAFVLCATATLTNTFNSMASAYPRDPLPTIRLRPSK